MSEITTNRTTESSSSAITGSEDCHYDPNRYRCDFPILGRCVASGAPLAFLDNAASTQRPQTVIDAISECYRQYYANVHRGIHTLSEESSEKYEESRRIVARFVRAASPEEVIFTAGATASINTVARSWGDANVSSGDVVLVTISDHHANIVPWHQLAQRVGCRVEFLPIDDRFLIDDEVVADHLDRLRPKIFAFAATSNVLGTNYPVSRWTSMARERGITTLVDAAQSVPHGSTDVQAMGADFLVFSGHKMCGPNGIGVLYGRRELLEAMPPFLGGGGMINRVTTTGFESAALPDKFEAGTPPIAEAIALGTAANYLHSIGMDRIEAHEEQLGRLAHEGLSDIDGVRVIGPEPEHKGGIVSFHVEGVHAHDVSQQLDTRGIAVRAGHHCTMPLHKALGLTSTTRASFYLYNTVDEVERLIDAVKELRTKFAPSGRRRRRRK
jgi:cysteine desulfurase/selenocysteine lyase